MSVFRWNGNPERALDWRLVMRRLDGLAVSMRLLPYPVEVDDGGRPLTDRGPVFAARRRLLLEFEQAHPGRAIRPFIADLDELCKWWLARAPKP